MRRLSISVILAILIVCGQFVSHGYSMSSQSEVTPVFHPVITTVKGDVKVQGKSYGVWEPAEVGLLLLSGDIIKTGKGAVAQIQFASGKIEMYETTVIVFPFVGSHERKKDIQDVTVNEGNVLFDINPQGLERGFEFRTKNIQGGVKGTVFTVGYIGEGSTINVYRGAVEVSDLDGTEKSITRLEAGMSLRVDKDDIFGAIKGFDPSFAIENYKYNIPPGLVGKSGLPADYNANPDNQGTRDRGQGQGKGGGKEGAPGQNM